MSSFGNGCALEGWCGVYSRISYLKERIERKMVSPRYCGDGPQTTTIKPESTTKSETTTQPEAVTTPKNCPFRWHPYLDGCYVLVQHRKSWKNSRKFCQSYQADLASVLSEGESDFVNHLAGGEAAWLGGRRACQDCKDFHWSDGSDWDFENWHSGEPDTQDKKVLCIQLRRRGDVTGEMTWRAASCSINNLQYFVCKK